METTNKIYAKIDEIIEIINLNKNSLFDDELKKRKTKEVHSLGDNSQILKTFAILIAYSQNANSSLVEKVIKGKIFTQAFSNFSIEEVIKLNPCDIADQYWQDLKGIRQQAKLFHIISLARKINEIGTFTTMIDEKNLPQSIKSLEDIDVFWNGFNKLQKALKQKKIPFFQSTISLLHFLLEMGCDCVKPDLVVMKVAKELGIVESEEGDKNLRKTVRFVQEYCVKRSLKPSEIDLYFLVYGGQKGAKKLMNANFYSTKLEK